MTRMKVGPKGQVVIPKKVRDQLGIRPGDDVVVDLWEGEARIRRLTSPQDLLGILGPDEHGMADWEKGKVVERELERRKEARWAAIEGDSSGSDG